MVIFPQVLTTIIVDVATAIVVVVIYSKGSPHLKKLTDPGLSALFESTGRTGGARKRAELVETSPWLGAAGLPRAPGAPRAAPEPRIDFLVMGEKAGFSDPPHSSADHPSIIRPHLRSQPDEASCVPPGLIAATLAPGVNSL